MSGPRHRRPTDPLTIALGYIERGWAPVPVSPQTKRPIGNAWQKRKITAETAPRYFNGRSVNIGVQMGKKSGGLTDVDLDCRESVMVASLLLPKTDVTFGRASKPRSHRLYVTGLADKVTKAAVQFKDVDGTMMLELRIGGGGKGSQSVFPGSVHTSGERIEWYDDGGPARVDDDKLLRSVQRLAVAVLLARHWPTKGGRHDAALTVGGFLVRAGLDEDEAVLMLKAIAQAAGDDEVADRVRAVRDAFQQYDNGGETRGMPALAEAFDSKVATKAAQWLGYSSDEPSGGKRPAKPHIKVIGGQLPRVVDEAEKALLASEHEVYQRGVLVRPAVVPLKASDERDTLGWRLIPIAATYLVDIMTRSASFVRWDARSKRYVPVDAPDKVAQTYLARAGEWKAPVLAGIVNTPFLRADGSVCQQPGYDTRSGMLFKPGEQTFPPIPERPSKKDACKALAKLREPIEHFPFVSAADEAVALSGMLSALDRCALPSAPPVHGYDAPVAGSGKSKLVDIASVVATGYDAPVIAQGRTEEELEKRLGAALLAGDAIVAIDNCSQPLESAFLCMMLTQQRVKVRILGKSVQPEVPSNAFVCATGNGLTFVGDLTRRSLRCALDPKVERPELRQFAFDPVALAREQRRELVVAGLTVLRAWLVSGDRVEVAPLGSFEVWSRRVREALVWLGCADPCATVENVRADDPERSALAAVLAQWEQHLGLFRRYTTAEVIKCATSMAVERADDGSVIARTPRTEFKAALLNIAGAGRGIDNRRLGIWLAQSEGKIVNSMRLLPKGHREGSKMWALVPKTRGGV